MANVPHLTEKQRKFIEILMKKGTFMSGKECAIEAGYAEDSAAVMASKLQNPKTYPLVAAEIEKRRNELNKRYSINYKSHINTLAAMRDKALEAQNYTAAIAAEKYRGMAAGLYIDRKEIRHGSIDQMSSKDVEEKLNELREKLRNGDDAKVVEGTVETDGEASHQGGSLRTEGNVIPFEPGTSSVSDTDE